MKQYFLEFFVVRAQKSETFFIFFEMLYECKDTKQIFMKIFYNLNVN